MTKSKLKKISKNLQIYLMNFLSTEEIILSSKFSRFFKNLFEILLKNLIILDSSTMKLNFFQYLLRNYNKIINNLEEILLNHLNLNKPDDISLLISILNVNKNSITLLRLNNCVLYSNSSTYKVYQILENTSINNLRELDLSNTHIGNDYIEILKYLNDKPVKKLSLANCQILSITYINFSINLPFLEELNVEENKFALLFSDIFLRPLSYPSLNYINFNKNDLNSELFKFISKEVLFQFKSLKRCDFQFNNINPNIYNTYVDLGNEANITFNFYGSIQKFRQNRNNIMRMIFSRSALYDNSIPKTQKLIGMKENKSILPLYIYPSLPEIVFSKEDLIKILKNENIIRLSNDYRLAFDNIKNSELDSHLEIDKQAIISALRKEGYNPTIDDSLKAYHLATGKYINDIEVKNEVVWMKYDKCRKGDYQVGDMFLNDKVKIYDLNGREYFLCDLLSKHERNFIVGGSLS